MLLEMKWKKQAHDISCEALNTIRRGENLQCESDADFTFFEITEWEKKFVHHLWTVYHEPRACNRIRSWEVPQ